MNHYFSAMNFSILLFKFILKTKGGQMVNRNSKAYRLCRVIGRIILIAAGYLVGKRGGVDVRSINFHQKNN